MKGEDDFLSDVEAFLQETGMSPTTFGWAALYDTQLVRELRNGSRELLPRTVRLIRNFMNGVRYERGTWRPEPRGKVRRAA